MRGTETDTDGKSSEDDNCDEKANVSDAEIDNNEDNIVLESLGQSRYNLRDRKKLLGY